MSDRNASQLRRSRFKPGARSVAVKAGQAVYVLLSSGRTTQLLTDNAHTTTSRHSD